MVVKARIIRIGNSRGLRLPKQILEQTGLGDEVELDVQQDRIVIRPARRPRADWEAQFRTMAEQGDDRLLDGDELLPTQWDDAEWEWPPGGSTSTS
jgi:antitoxin MazE